MAIANEEWGPLPEGDRQDTLQEMSLKALQTALPESMLVFRHEPVSDKGVDGSLEVKVERTVKNAKGNEEARLLFTNCRAQAQVKSTDKPKLLQNGAASLSVETSNLNHLLNGQSPIYFLWIAPSNEIRFVWARDESKRLAAENAAWGEQSSVTLHFRHVLTAESVKEICERIVTEARFERRIHESLAASAMSEQVVIGINPSTLETTDPKQLYERLATSGMTIVSSGYGLEAMTAFGVLNAESKNDGRLQLVAAYAQYTLGRYLEAKGHQSAASLRRKALSIPDQDFLDHLRDVIDYKIGRIGLKEYERNQAVRGANQAGVTKLLTKFATARESRVHERNPARRSELLREMQQFEAEIRAAADATSAIKLQSAIVLANAEGEDLVKRIIESTMALKAGKEMGLGIELFANEARDLLREWKQWDEAALGTVKEAAGLLHPLLVADAINSRLTVYLMILVFRRIEAAVEGKGWNVSDDEIRSLMTEAEEAMRIFEKAGNLEGKTRSQLFLADFFEHLGNGTAARNMAEGALTTAMAMGYDGLQTLAEAHISGNTRLRLLESLAITRQNEDEDLGRAGQTDEEVRSLAEFTLDLARLPADRLGNVEREVLSQRLIARERLGWCRHIDLVQDLAHEQDRSTHYAIDPPRKCICHKHRYVSAMEDPDGATVIAAFKQAYCAGCPDRDPKTRE